MVDFSSTYGRIFKLLVLFKMKGTQFRKERSPIPDGIQSQTRHTLVTSELKHQIWDWTIFHVLVKHEIFEFWSNLVFFVDEGKGSHRVHALSKVTHLIRGQNLTIHVSSFPNWSYFHLLFILVSSEAHRKRVDTIFTDCIQCAITCSYMYYFI